MAAKSKKLDTVKKKPKVTRSPLFLDEKYTGEEPVWDTEQALEFSETEFENHLIRSLNYYNYFYTSKDLKSDLVSWLRGYSEEHKVFDKKTIDKFAKSSDSVVPLTACSLVKANSQGMPLLPKHIDYIINIVKRVTNMDTIDIFDEESAQVVKKVTIQDRLNEILKEHIFHFEEVEDELFEGKSADPKAYEYLVSKNVPQAMLSRIAASFEDRYNEILEAKAGTCDQLKEAYRHLKAVDYKRYEAFYTKLFDGIAQYGTVKKATKKARVRKPLAKEKLVAKLKFLKNDSVLKLVSINPVDIIGASQLWVYNVKTRKLGKYIAENADKGGVLSIKGTAIVGYDENLSVCKTLRKPEQQVKEVMGLGKVPVRKFLDTIKATEVKLNGRINSDTILLKVG